MSAAKDNLPSAGFAAIATSYTLLAALLIWGWQTPRLDKAFRLLNTRELDANVEFSTDDIQVLQKVWDTHAGFSRALLGKAAARFVEPTESGWISRPKAHLAVRPETEQLTLLTLEARGKPDDFPLKVRLFGRGLERQVELTANQTQKVEWSPTDLKQPSILEVEVTAPNSPANDAPRSWAIRVTTNSPGSTREAHD